MKDQEALLSLQLLCPHCVRANLASLDVPNEDLQEGALLTCVREHTSAIRSRSVSRRACGSHHSAPFTHSDLDNSCEKGAVARSPFDIQFISASSTEPVRRSSVGIEGCKCVSRALIVLRAFASSPLSVLAAQFREFFPTAPDLGAIPRFRPRTLLRRAVTQRWTGFNMPPAGFSEVFPAITSGSNSIYTAALLGTGLRSKKVRETDFFSSPLITSLSSSWRAQTESGSLAE